MRRGRHSREKIVQILREAEKPGAEVGAVCKTHGVSEATFYRWKKMYSGVSKDEAKKLKQLEQENTRMRKLIVDRDLELEVARELLKKIHNCK